MTMKWAWTARAFRFEYPVEKAPDIIERFADTPARLEARFGNMAEALHARDPGDGGWTIIENLGHMLELESLWRGRLDDFLAGASELRAADMTNRATREAGYNGRRAADLLAAFRGARTEHAERLRDMDAEILSREALHPRLRVTMRVIDAVSFVCEHDDYHIARIAELARRFAGRG